uniref:Choline transporter-like protein n=1 Tax=Angiostrongylus cantonensis TaxID=6313 RepID=A0A0K0D1Y2_ANGCA
MIWTSIFCIISVLGTGCGFSWYKWLTMVKAGAIDDYSFQPLFSLYFEMPTTWFAVAFILSIALLILSVVLIFIRKRISIAVALIEESSRAIGHMMSTLIFPLFPFALHLLVIILWGTIAIWLASSGVKDCRTNNSSNTTCDCSTTPTVVLNIDPKCTFFGLVKEEKTIFWLQLYNLFIFFWMTCFVSSLGNISLAGAFASYYWAKNKPQDVPSFPVLRALGRAIRHHLGSLAFGSLIIAATKFIRALLDYLDKKLSTTNNQVFKVVLSTLKCCFWCMEVFLKFLTKNAFIMMAIYGKSFFVSAKESFLLLARNCVRAAVVNQVAGFLLFLGKALITLGMGDYISVVAFFYFSGQWVVNGIPRVDLYYYFVPIILVLIGSYFVTDLFFDVYEMAVDTTFICFLEDSEQNDGTIERPFYMSKDLQKILNKKNEK